VVARVMCIVPGFVKTESTPNPARRGLLTVVRGYIGLCRSWNRSFEALNRPIGRAERILAMRVELPGRRSVCLVVVTYVFCERR
jgi:hypothetical protein